MLDRQLAPRRALETKYSSTEVPSGLAATVASLMPASAA